MKLFKWLALGGHQELPQRISSDIANRQNRSEQIISALQLFIIGTFGLLYMVAPQPQDRSMLSEVVPIALIAYLLFTLLRLYLAYKKNLPAWFLVMSCGMDVAILYIVIWSFFNQYDQPPSFVLKSPTVLYAFIFIALRALRFDSVYVIITGVFAVVGWLIIVACVLSLEGMGVITRDYVEYMTSNRVLLGAEFDKMISILMVTGIIVVSSVRSRNLLLRAVRDNLARGDMARFFTRDVADKITNSDEALQAGSGERLQASVMNIDIRGFTKLSARMSAVDLIELLSDYQRRLVPVIESFGGSIDKFMGDGIMATFGTSGDSAHFAKQALLSIPDIFVAVSGVEVDGSPLRIGVAVASGELIYGVLGAENRLEYTSIGEPVNLSAKLEKYNSENGTLAVCDVASLELAQAQGLPADYAFEVRSEAVVGGVAEPMDVVVVR